jgi:hypothetical protein
VIGDVATPPFDVPFHEPMFGADDTEQELAFELPHESVVGVL